MNCYNSDSVYNVFWEVIRLHYLKTHKILEKLNLYPGQPPLLFTILSNNGINQKELSQKLKIKPSTITIMLRRLEKSGLIKKEQDLRDQRISRVYITDKGRKICEEMKGTMKLIEDTLFNNFSEQEKENLKNLLKKIRENLQNTI